MVSARPRTGLLRPLVVHPPTGVRLPLLGPPALQVCYIPGDPHSLPIFNILCAVLADVAWEAPQAAGWDQTA